MCQVVSNRIYALDVAKNVIWEQTRRIDNTCFDRETVGPVVLDDSCWLLETESNNLVEDILDEKMSLNNQSEFIRMMTESCYVV